MAIAPVRLDPWQNIVNVHWGDEGGGGATNPPTNFPQWGGYQWKRTQSLDVGAPLIKVENNFFSPTIPGFQPQAVPGQMFFAHIGTNNPNGIAPTPPSGFNQIFLTSIMPGVTTFYFGVWWKYVESYETEASYQFIFDAGSGGGGIAHVNWYAGVDESDPIGPFDFDVVAPGGDVITPALTTNRDKSHVFHAFNNYGRAPWLFPDLPLTYEDGDAAGGRRWNGAGAIHSVASASLHAAEFFDDNWGTIGGGCASSIQIQAPLTFA